MSTDVEVVLRMWLHLQLIIEGGLLIIEVVLTTALFSVPDVEDSIHAEPSRFGGGESSHVTSETTYPGGYIVDYT